MLTGAEFVQRLYLDGYTLEQRNFGILGNLKKGLNRSVTVIKSAGKSISNPKKYIYENPMNSALQSRVDRYTKGIKYSNINNQNVSSNLEDIARDNNVSILRGVPNSNYITDSDLLLSELEKLRKQNKITPTQLRKFRDILIKNNGERRKVIALVSENPSENPEILAHELGHYLNSRSKGLSGLISKGSKSSGGLNFRRYYEMRRGTELRNKDGIPTVKEQLKRSIGSRLVGLEEKNATKRAIRLLRKSGMEKDQLNTAKSNLNKSYNSYKDDGILYRKYMNYRRFFQPKSDWRENSFVNPPINTNYL